jgi:hypothetical protein
MLKVRAELRLYAARLVDIPAVQAKGLLVLVHELPENAGLEITAINFADTPVEENVSIRGVASPSKATDAIDAKAPMVDIDAAGKLRLRLAAYEAKALLIRR